MLVTVTTVIDGTIEPILELVGAKAVFYGISIAEVARLLGLERFCQRFRRDMGGCAFLLSLIFYKICTKIIHKIYVGLRSRVSVHGVRRTLP